MSGDDTTYLSLAHQHAHSQHADSHHVDQFEEFV
jgi:hypothetical protein